MYGLFAVPAVLGPSARTPVAVHEPVELRGGVPQMGHQLLADLRLGHAGTNRIDTCMCGGSANQRCLPPQTNGERFRLTVARPARATPLARGMTPCSAWGPPGPPRATYRPPRPPGSRRRPPSAAGSRSAPPWLRVSVRTARRYSVASWSPGRSRAGRAGADPRLWELLLEPDEFLGLEVADEHGVQRQPGGAQPVHPADDLLGTSGRRCGQRQVDREAFQRMFSMAACSWDRSCSAMLSASSRTSPRSPHGRRRGRTRRLSTTPSG
ncbi:hypothetical protein SVIOM74S_09564 [Streptomyces violarus]